MSTENAHFLTLGTETETETEAEIWSTFTDNCMLCSVKCALSVVAPKIA